MSIRTKYVSGLLIIILLLIASFYFQFVDNVLPCPLCILQRFAFGLLGLWFLIGIFVANSSFGRIIINLLCFLTSILGMVLAGRQLFLQYFPSLNTPECGVSIQYMLDVLPFNEVVQKIFAGGAECSQRGFEILHLNLAEWAFIWFIIFLLFSLRLFQKSQK